MFGTNGKGEPAPSGFGEIVTPSSESLCTPAVRLSPTPMILVRIALPVGPAGITGVDVLVLLLVHAANKTATRPALIPREIERDTTDSRLGRRPSRPFALS